MKYISINKHVIAANARHGRNDPPISVRTTKSGKATYCHNVRIHGDSSLIYNAETPILKCGARLVLMTESGITAYDDQMGPVLVLGGE